MLELPSPLASALSPVAVLKLKLPLASALLPVAVFTPKSPLASALLPVGVLALKSPLALALVPQATFPVAPVAVAPAPVAVAGPTVEPSLLPTHTNCASAGVTGKASNIAPATNVARARESRLYMEPPIQA